MLIQVLIIDEDSEITGLSESILPLESFEVRSTDSGPKGVEMVRQMHFDILIVNLPMPVMDGFDVCGEIRKFSNIPILILSAINKPEVIVRILDRGADDYLVKPIHKNVLIAHINKVVRRARNGHCTIRADGIYPV